MIDKFLSRDVSDLLLTPKSKALMDELAELAETIPEPYFSKVLRIIDLSGDFMTLVIKDNPYLIK